MSKEDEQKEHFDYLLYKMFQEGFDYCFDGYSEWQEIDDETFHRLRKQYLSSKNELKHYILNKCKELELDFEEEDYL